MRTGNGGADNGVWMKVFPSDDTIMKKATIIIAAVFLVLFAAIEFYVQTDSFAERIRPFVIEPLREVLGADVKIGFVKANFIPPYLEARNISFPDAEGREVAAIRRIRVYINPLPLLLKKVRLPLITVLEPRIYAERSPDGSLNIVPIAERIRTNLARSATTGASKYTVLLKTVTVRNGQIWYKDPGLSSQASVTGINTVVRVNLANDLVAAQIRNSRVRVALPAYPVLEGTLKAVAEYHGGKIRLESADIVAGDAALNVRGAVNLLPEMELELKTKVMFGPQSLGSAAAFLKQSPKRKNVRIEASAAVAGKVSNLRIDGSLGYSGISYGETKLKDGSLAFQYRDRNFSLRGDRLGLEKDGKSIVVDRLAAVIRHRNGILEVPQADLTADDLSLRMSGTIDPSTGLDLRLSVESSAAGRTLSFLTADAVGGTVRIEGRLNGALKDPVFGGEITAGPVTVRKVQFDAISGLLAYEKKLLSLSDAVIQRQSARYVFAGTADFSNAEPVYSAKLKISQSDVNSIVALFYRSLPLQIAASGELLFQGTATRYTGSGHLSLEAGSAYGETFTRGAITATLSTGKISFPQVVLYKKRGMVKATGWIGFDGTYSAELESRDINLASVDHLSGVPVDGDFLLEVRSSGSFSSPMVNASLDVEALSYRSAPVGHVRAGAELKNNHITLSAGMIENPTKISFRWLVREPYTWTADVKIQTNGINPVLLFAGPDIAERVKADAEGAITLRGAGLSLSSLSGEAVFQRLGAAVGDYRIDNAAQAGFVIRGDKIAITSLDFAGPGTRIGVSGSMTLSHDLNIAVKGTMNLPLLKLFYREVEYAAGTAGLQLTVTDEWNNPNVAGELRIAEGELKIKDIPQKFTALNGKIEFFQGRILTESLAAEIGGGTLNMSGWAQLSGAALQDFSMKTSVSSVTVRYPEGLTSTLTGNLYYDGDRRQQTLSGDITIKKARYDKNIEWKTMLVDVGRGLYQKKQTDVGWIGETQINVRFHGSDNIVFTNNLAKMPLEVDVFLRGTVNHPQLLGRIEAEKGTVYFRKNDFKILHASVDFVDPNRMNPVLDIQAETQVREYQIRLAVTGTAERASVTFISDPALDDTDILSMLALGKKSSELAGKETSVGVGEAASFATGQFQDIFENRARGLTGLDRFQVDPYVDQSNTSVPRVTVGKELVQNKLYVTYSSNVGAAIPEQVFSLEYILNKHYSLVGEKDETGNTGADIKYRFEFD